MGGTEKLDPPLDQCSNLAFRIVNQALQGFGPGGVLVVGLTMAVGQPGSQLINAVCLYAASEVAQFRFWTKASVFPHRKTCRVNVEKLGGLFGGDQLPGERLRQGQGVHSREGSEGVSMYDPSF